MPDATSHPPGTEEHAGPSPARLAALRATAAAAAAEAAAARLAAAEAALAAAEAAAAEAAAAEAAAARAAAPAESAVAAAAPTGAAAPSAEAADAAAAAAGAAITSADTDEAPAEPPAARDEWADVVAQGYSVDGAVLPLGVLVVDGRPLPDVPVGVPLRMLNRHGLVAGATGTGKTTTLQVMAEGLVTAGVPVFLADLKGDLSGLAVPGVPNDRLLDRTAAIGQSWTPRGYAVELYTLGGMGTGVPIRTTVTDLGPLLLAKVLGLSSTQESSLGLIFHWADTQGLDLVDLADLRATITYLVSDQGRDQLRSIGGLSRATAGVILREITGLQAQGADAFFGEPAFDTADLLRTTPEGHGVVSALELPGVQDRPALFSTFLMWLLADLFQDLPEVGDADRPRLVFFFDEAHLLFAGASDDFLAQVTRTVRLIRSKGVGIVFVTQTPKDVPADVLAQLGSRVQHALRAFTPDDAAALRAAARTFPHSPYALETVLTSLGIGEAVVTVLSESGTPTPVAITRLRAPESAMEPAPAAELERIVATSPVAARYGTVVDPESAAEVLAERAAQERLAEQEAAAARERAEAAEREADAAARAARKQAAELERMRARLERDARASGGAGRARSRTGSGATTSSGAPSGTTALDALLRAAGGQLGREITRTIFGTRRR